MPSATAVTFAFALLLTASPALAQNPSTIALHVDSACPSRALVEAALLPLLRDYELREDQANNVAYVRDLGESYRVSVNGAAREVADPERQCLERARVSAVFVMLNLAQPVPSGPAATEPPAPAAAAVSTPPAVVVAPSAQPRPVLALRAFAQVESAPSAALVSTSVGMGATWHSGPLGLSLVGAFATPTEPRPPDGSASRVRLWRAPCGLLLGWEVPLGLLLSVALEGGAALDVLRLQGGPVPNADGGTRFNLGLRGNAALRLRASRRLQAELGPSFSYFPRTYLARVEPSWVVAETPRWWLGVGLGLHFSIWEK